MKKKILLFIGLIALVSCRTEKVEIEKFEQHQEIQGVPGVAIVQFDSKTADDIYASMGCDKVSNALVTKAFTATKASNSSEIVKELGIRQIERLFPFDAKWEKRHREYGLHTFYRVEYDTNVPQTKAHDSLYSLGNVITVEPQTKIKPTASGISFNDPYSSELWHLYNNGKKNGFKSGMDINVLPVWESFTTGSAEVVVAVVDDGVAINHPDLKGVVIPGTKDGGSRSFVYGHEGPNLTADIHGTHVSAIIGGINNNKTGVCGIAGGNNGKGGVRILACQIMEEIPNKEDVLQGNSAQAIVWGADNGAVISQNSWGYDGYSFPSADRVAIDYFIDKAGLDEDDNQIGPMAGGVVFFAAGNDNETRSYPAMYERVIAVGAIGPNGKKASYSNYGSWVDICAPGGEYVGYRDDDPSPYILSACGEDSYLYMCGTSQACPQVSGVAALLVSYYGGIGFTNEMLLTKLIEGANSDAPSKSQKIGPMLDAYGSFSVGESLPDLELVSDCDNEIKLKSHESTVVRVSAKDEVFLNIAYSLDTECKGITTSVEDGVFILNINALKAEPGIYNLNVKAESRGKNASLNIILNILPNNPPTIKSDIQDIIIETKDRVEINLEDIFEDLDGEQLSYKCQISNSNVARYYLGGDNKNMLILTPNGFGQTSITVSASDARGDTCSLKAFTYLFYDVSRGADTYPNPVTDYLYIGAGCEKEMNLVLNNTNGAVLFEETMSGSSLNPIKIDMSSFAPGIYSLSLKYGNNNIKKTIIKK